MEGRRDQGKVDLDDSMNSSLLPGEKLRTKKDWGQTLYKKPGPPTPSKNGGRLSLQGNEVHPREVLREQNTGRRQSRIKSLFSRSASRDKEVKVEEERNSICNCFGNRLSELQYRNSLCPPHLKSCYPAETQVISSGQWKEDEIKKLNNA